MTGRCSRRTDAQAVGIEGRAAEEAECWARLQGGWSEGGSREREGQLDARRREPPSAAASRLSRPPSLPLPASFESTLGHPRLLPRTQRQPLPTAG